MKNHMISNIIASEPVLNLAWCLHYSCICLGPLTPGFFSYVYGGGGGGGGVQGVCFPLENESVVKDLGKYLHCWGYSHFPVIPASRSWHIAFWWPLSYIES